MRVWVERVYGTPPEQVIGSSIVTKFEMVAGMPVLTGLPQLSLIPDALASSSQCFSSVICSSYEGRVAPTMVGHPEVISKARSCLSG